MRKSKILDYKWYKQIQKINKILLTVEKDPTPELVVDHTHRTLEIHTQRQKKSKIPKGLTRKVKKKFDELQKLRSKIEKEEKNQIIKSYYLQLIKDLESNLHLYKLKKSKSYIESEKNEKVHKVYQQLFPIPPLEYRSVFISEFIDFINYIKKENLFKISEIPFINELTSPQFYNINYIDTKTDFSKITQSYLEFIENHTLQNGEKFSAKKIKKIFKAFLHKIYISQDIKVKIRNKYLFSVDTSNIYIPAKANHNKVRIIKLIAHEILVHAYRSILGNRNRNTQKEKLFLLKTGNSLNTPIEEGLGAFVEQNIFYESSKYDICNLFNFYLRLIAVHIGLDNDPYEVYEKLTKLCTVFGYVYNLSEKDRNKARDILVLRIYRGYKRPQKGCVNGRVAQYLYGNRLIWEFIENGGSMINLYAGKIQISQIDGFKKLGFEVPEKFLGHSEFPRHHILRLIDECFESL